MSGSTPEGPRFRSAVDRWLAVVLVAGPAVGVLLPLFAAYGHAEWPWPSFISAVVFGAIYGLFLFPLWYELGEDAVIIRFGRFRSRVRYAELRAVRPTGNPISSPALSLDRLHLDAGSALGPNISPRERDAFLDALVARCPHLRREGDALVPREPGR